MFNDRWLSRVGSVFVIAGMLAVPQPAAAVDPAGFEYAFLFGISSGPFKTDSDLYVGGTLNVPIFAQDPLLGQKLLGEIMVGWSQTSDDGTFSAPFAAPVPDLAGVGTPSGNFDLTTVQVIPGVKYKLAFMDWVEPYVAAGIAFNVTLSRTTGGGQERAGGIAPVSPELSDRGVPAGQGNVLIGGNFGGGFDVFLHPNIFLGADVRHNAMDRKGADFQTFLGKVGFRF